MRQGSVTCLVCGQTANAGDLCGRGKAARLGTVHGEVVAEILTRVSRVS
jgi:phosphoribosyl-dephospho-CoA transferase